MNIFKLTPDCNRYQNLVFSSKEDWAIFDRFDGRNVLPFWTQPVVQVLRDKKFNRNLPPGDFPNLFLPGVPVFSLRAVDVLKNMLQENGEILPLSCNEGEYYAYNVTTTIDALDESKSELERFKSSGRIMEVSRYVFFGDRLIDASIFKIPQFPRTDVYVTDKFRKIVDDNHLIGFDFVNLWKG
jgi:hypothetical protein